MMTISCPKEELVMTTAKGEDLILLLSTDKDIYQYDLSANRKLKLVDVGYIDSRYLRPMDYWLKGSINVMDLNTKQRKVLFNGTYAIAYAIAVDPSKGLIFWTDYTKIERASMDGNDRMTIANSSSPCCIALDIFNERVYWADDIKKTIASVDYNGNDWRTILHSDTLVQFPTSLAIFEEKLYWTDMYHKSVFVMNKFNGTEVRKLISVDGYDLLVNPYPVRVYHSAVQPELPNKCDQHSCGDGAICLPKGNSFDKEGKPQSRIGLPYSCVCADGYTTGKEPNTCVLGI
uniref:Vitellogenin receptor n=1 Tax=Acrobeloides nanus TaxID=290746 RepID=A0A914CVV9_9BILA